MIKFQDLDPTFPIERQIEVETGPVTLLNLLIVDKKDEQAMIAAWTDDAKFMQSQPGFISTQLHRSIGEGCAYLNYAVWETNAAFRNAFMHPKFQQQLSKYPSSAVAMPHLFEKVAIPGICVA